jgi:aminoglycoside/choline kinase family phosphotransferase
MMRDAFSRSVSFLADWLLHRQGQNHTPGERKKLYTNLLFDIKNDTQYKPIALVRDLVSKGLTLLG